MHGDQRARSIGLEIAEPRRIIATRQGDQAVTDHLDIHGKAVCQRLYVIAQLLRTRLEVRHRRQDRADGVEQEGAARALARLFGLQLFLAGDDIVNQLAKSCPS